MNHLLARLDPGNSALLVAATSAVIVGLVTLGAGLVGRICRKLGASARHDLDLGALVVTLLSPALVVGVARSGFVLIAWPITTADPPVEEAPIAFDRPALPARSIARLELPEPDREPIVADEPARTTGVAVPRPEPVPTPAPVPVLAAPVEIVVPTDDGRRAWAGAVVLAWGIGFVWLGVRLVAGMGWLFALGRRLRPIASEPLDRVRDDVCRALGVRWLPPIFEASELPGPVACGLIRSVVVLPIGMAEGLGSSGLRDVLIHECAHVLRRDPLIGLLQRLAALVFWPHPLVHRLNRRLARAREEACDDMVLRESDACGYARTLLILAESGGPTGRVGPVVGLFETPWKLEDRVVGILNRPKERKMRTIRGLKLASIAVLALTGAAVAAIRPVDETVERFEPESSRETIQDDGSGGVITGQVVDEAGTPVAGASVNVLWFPRAAEDAQTAADGRFTLRVPGPIRSSGLVRASADRDARLGLTLYEEPGRSHLEPTRIVLKPARSVAAVVVDAADKPVAGASVEIRGEGSIAQGTTDASGVARFRIPLDAKVDQVAALKSGVGFDYYENYRSWPSSRRDPLPAEVKLVLDGARPATVKAVDSQGKPVAGVELTPWTIEKPGKLGYFNCEIGMARTRTDAAGIARFDWIPSELAGQASLAVLTIPWEYHAPDSQILSLRGDRTGTLTVLRAVKLSGKVTNPDGSPARGIMLKAMSEGKTNHYGSGVTQTGDDGSYSFLMPPNQIAMIAVIDPERASRTLNGIFVRENEPQDGLDLRLVAGTRFVARMLDVAGQPDPKATLTLIYLGGGLPEQFNGGNTQGDRQELVHWAKANAQGVVELRLGPGDYQVVGHDKFQVAGPDEIVREYRRSKQEYDPNPTPLTGQVVDATGASGKPVAGAIVRFSPSRKQGGADIKARADAEGRFVIEPHFGSEGSLLVANDRDGKLAGMRVVPRPGEDVKIELIPAATASGRVVDADGKPVAWRRVQLTSEFPPLGDVSAQTYESTATDATGRYHFAGLMPGTQCEVAVEEQEHLINSFYNGSVAIEKFKVNGPDPIRLPDVTLTGKPVVVPFPAEVGKRFEARDVVGANPMPYAITRGEVEALVKAIGREPATAEVVNQVGRVVRPQEHWITDLTKIRRFATDPQFVALADRASIAVRGKPVDTATLVDLANARQIGYGEASLRNWLATARDQKPTKQTRGIVEDAATGQPIAGATVFNESAITTTDARGEFTIVGSSRRNAWIEAEGYALVEVIPSTDLAKPTKVALVREKPITGRVVERGTLKPVAGAIVWAMVDHWSFLPDHKKTAPEHYGFPITARTDAEGRFAFRGLPPGLTLDWYEVRHLSLRQTRTNREDLSADEQTIITVEPGAVVSGVVVDEAGRGLADTSVSLRPHNHNMDQHWVTTDQDGSYSFGNLAPGRWELTVQPERQALKRISVFAEDGRPAINQIVVEAGWTIGGKVVDQAGQPIAGATVCWPTLLDATGNPNEANQINRFVYTELDGSFQLAGLPPGKYRLRVAAPSSRRELKVDAAAGKADVLIQFP